MTLRDYFAAVALGGLLAAGKDVGWGLPEAVSRRAYEFADAMIVVGEKETGK